MSPTGMLASRFERFSVTRDGNLATARKTQRPWSSCPPWPHWELVIHCRDLGYPLLWSLMPMDACGTGVDAHYPRRARPADVSAVLETLAR